MLKVTKFDALSSVVATNFLNDPCIYTYIYVKSKPGYCFGWPHFTTSLCSIYITDISNSFVTCHVYASVGIAGGLGGSTPQFISSTPQFDLFVCLGGSENNPPDCTCLHVCAIIALAQFLSRHLSKILDRYSITIAVKIENIWFLVNYSYVQLICTLHSLDRSWKIYF